jgi:hypothetical protein
MGWVVNATPRPLYPREGPGTHCIGGQQAESGRVRTISPPPEFDPRTFKPVASRYTEWAIEAHTMLLYTFNVLFLLPLSYEKHQIKQFDSYNISNQ